MKNTDILVNLLIADIENKAVLEVACGAADFSVSASTYSNNVYCIDLDAGRLENRLAENLHFQIMDASKMDYADDTFDTVILYLIAEIRKSPVSELCTHGNEFINGDWNSRRLACWLEE